MAEYRPSSSGRPVISRAPVNLFLKTDAAGAFNVAGLEPGRYSVCALPIDSRAQLSTCAWLPGPTVTLSNAAANQSAEAGLIAARTVTPRVNDPSRRAETGPQAFREKWSSRVNLTLADARGKATVARFALRDGDDLVFEAIVPVDRDMIVVVDSDLPVFDPLGVKMPSRAPSSLLFKRGAAPETIRLSIR